MQNTLVCRLELSQLSEFEQVELKIKIVRSTLYCIYTFLVSKKEKTLCFVRIGLMVCQIGCAYLPTHSILEKTKQ